MRELAIESDVPIPKKGPQPRTVGGRAAHKMKIGDSVFTEHRTEMETLRSALYSLGGKAECRKRVENNVSGWRIWRKA